MEPNRIDDAEIIRTAERVGKLANQLTTLCAAYMLHSPSGPPMKRWDDFHVKATILMRRIHVALAGGPE